MWEIKSERSDKANIQNIGLFHRKVNNSSLHEPLGYSVQFLPTQINVNGFDISDSDELNTELPIIQRIHNYLRDNDQHKNLQDILDFLGFEERKAGSVRAMMSRSTGVAKNIKHFGNGLWGIKGKTYLDDVEQILDMSDNDKMPWDD